jgi:hypothetical protein
VSNGLGWVPTCRYKYCTQPLCKPYAAHAPVPFDWSNPTELVSPEYGRVSGITDDLYGYDEKKRKNVRFEDGSTWLYRADTGIWNNGTDQLARKPLPVAAAGAVHKAFFYVWRRVGGSPSAPHATLALASAEAQRLSKANQGSVFTVIQTVEDVITPKPVPTAPVVTKLYA